MKASNIIIPRCSGCVYRRGVGIFAVGYCTIHEKDIPADHKCEHFASIANKGEFQRIKALIAGAGE